MSVWLSWVGGVHVNILCGGWRVILFYLVNNLFSLFQVWGGGCFFLKLLFPLVSVMSLFLAFLVVSWQVCFIRAVYGEDCSFHCGNIVIFRFRWFGIASFAVVP